ncbi:Aste57867_22604 [Aphanomyces stellatus]|uniref:Aste57867_22604 protein n=1 Tax=Aphanomyces stellatus TaxID=120398 RepID=A0A485LM60_9STRA|nr:hypothetical protein As57867_022534 [Aphanomyces stellatus]VFT99261.1 Aste57867_22604 [Aphanomyces stellatus]
MIGQILRKGHSDWLKTFGNNNQHEQEQRQRSRGGGRDGGGRGGDGGRGSAPVVTIPLTPPPAPVKSTLLKLLDDMHNPARPGFGTAGRRVTLWANHFAVTLKQNQGDDYHYDAAIAPEGKPPSETMPPKDLCSDVLQLLLTNLKTLCCRGRRPTQLRPKGGKTETFDVHVKAATPVAVRLESLGELFAGRLNYTPYDAIQALDIAMRYSASIRFTTVGRNFFNNTGALSLGEGAELWFGYQRSRN